MDIFTALFEDGITWPEAFLGVGMLAFAGFCIIAMLVLLMILLDRV